MATNRISTASERPNFKKLNADKYIIQNFCKNNQIFDVEVSSFIMLHKWENILPYEEKSVLLQAEIR